MKLTKCFCLFLFLFSCNKKNTCQESEPFDPRSSVYISLETIEGKKYCMAYNELLKVTSYDFLDNQTGKGERIDIYCGVTKLDSLDVAKILNDMNSTVYEIVAIPDSINPSLKVKEIMDSTGIFRVKDLDFTFRGNIINEAIKKGYIIYFDDNEGEYFWE